MKKSICFLFAIKLGICFFCFFFLSCEEEFKVDMPDNIANGIVFLRGEKRNVSICGRPEND